MKISEKTRRITENYTVRLREKLSDISKGYYALLLIFSVAALGLNNLDLVIFVLLVSDVVISKYMAMYGPPGIGVEVASINTVIAGFVHGPEFGAAIGFVSIVLRMFTGLAGEFLLWKLPGFALLGYIAGVHLQTFLPGAIITILGMRALFTVFSHYLSFTPTSLNILFNVTNLAFITVIARQIQNLVII